jgi:hypothetical protein
MAATYDAILVPIVERESTVKLLEDALTRLGQCMVRRVAAVRYGRFGYLSTKMIFVAPSGNSRWLPLRAEGRGLKRLMHWTGEWYLLNPLAMAISYGLSPVIYLFSLRTRDWAFVNL